VAQEHLAGFADFCHRVRTTDAKQTCEVKLLGGGQPAYAIVEGIAAHDHPGHEALCRAAVIDITQRRLLEESLRAAQATLQREQQTLRDLLAASDHDRKLIAYEIHDGLAQHLAAATMYFQAAESLRARDPLQAAQAFTTGTAMLHRSHTEARRLINDVRPPILDEEGVAAAIAHLVHDQRSPGAPSVEFHCDAELPRLNPVIENALYRIAQEGLTNACKHAKSKSVRIDLAQQGNESVRIEIRDWGVGFDEATIRKESFGLQGIRERARLLGGRVVVESQTGQGTRITVELPLVLPRASPCDKNLRGRQ
jgi:signal transduction histidine kinase